MNAKSSDIVVGLEIGYSLELRLGVGLHGGHVRHVGGALLASVVGHFVKKNALDGNVGFGVGVPVGPPGNVCLDAGGGARAVADVDVAERVDVGVGIECGYGGDVFVVVAGLAVAWSVVGVEDDLELGVCVVGDGGEDGVPCGWAAVCGALGRV